MRSLDKIQGEKRRSPSQPTRNKFLKSASNVFANYPPYTQALLGCKFIPGVFVLPLQPGRLSFGSLLSRAKQDPSRSEGKGHCVCAQALTPANRHIRHRILKFCDRYSADWLPLPAFQSPSMVSIRMCFWRQLFAHPRWKRNFYRLGSARSSYFHTNWYQVRRNLRRQLFRGKIISS